MWPYFLVFFAALAVDTIPVFAPPAWILLVVLLVKFKLNPWLTLVIGVTGSTIGRYVLTRYIPKISSRIVNRREAGRRDLRSHTFRKRGGRRR